MENFIYVYIFMLAAFTGYEVISRVPVILHTPLMSGSNFVHGVAKVMSVASSMPTPAQTMPRLAVTGDAMAFRPRMNSTATTK